MHEEAITHLRHALVLSPQSASSHAAIALSYHSLGQLDRAILEYHNVNLMNLFPHLSLFLLSSLSMPFVGTASFNALPHPLLTLRPLLSTQMTPSAAACCAMR
jgi:hypothetical protein